MDDAEREEIQRWFREKWNHGDCPVCQTNVWVPLLDEFAQIENLDRVSGRVPVLLIHCQNCGYLLAINAIAAGIRQPPHAINFPAETVE